MRRGARKRSGYPRFEVPINQCLVIPLLEMLCGTSNGISGYPFPSTHQVPRISDICVKTGSIRHGFRARQKTRCNLRACFVGRLHHTKVRISLIEAAVPLLKARRLHIDVMGDGPLMARLREIVEQEGLADSVSLHGWVQHSALQDLMCQSQLLAFPSIREFGGGVVLEAMALGLVPLIVDYAGPSELVTGHTGFKVPLGSREKIVAEFRQRLIQISDDRAVYGHWQRQDKSGACNYSHGR